MTNKVRLLPVAALAAVLTSAVLPACTWLSVYKIDIPQGTPINPNQLAQVKVGMNQNQVLYLLGSPAVRDTLNPNRWDYIYDFTAGKIAQREGKPDIHNAQQYVKIYFDSAGNVSRIERPTSAR
ncbi:outer membrane protein assembly factor BamE [Faucicola atlantae]|uniref:outer membrane protein assembly factor BamE n=1 Tax=Faucicola atlantae TaxID=34059 RepID=UPI0025AFFABA|nr:outer membrane protein assembly factor BamE [Moraxella atlantae]